MGLFSLTKKSKAPATADASDGRRVGERVLVYATSQGWHTAVQQLDGSLTDHQSGETVLVDGGESSPPVATTLQAAVTANLPTIQRTNNLFLLLDELSVHVTDRQWGNSGNEEAWQYGRQWLHTDDCLMAYAEWPPVDEGAESKQRQAIHAFIDAQQLSNYLAPVTQMGVHVTGIFPQELLLVQKSARSEEPIYGGLQIGSHTSTLVLVNQSMGTLQIRKIPVGFSSLIKAAARKVGISERDASRALSRQELLTELAPIASNDLDEILLLQSHEAGFYGVRSALTRLLDDMKEHLAFFAAQEGNALPSRLELFGANERMTGLTEWLNRYLGLPVVPYHPSLLELFAQMEPSATSQFFSPAQHMPAKLTSSLPAQRIQDRKWFVAGLGLLAVLHYWGYSEYQGNFKRYQILADRYQATVSEREQLQKKLSAYASQTVSTRETETTKLIMVEKLLALANLMTNSIWLTDIYFTDQESKGVDGKNVKTLVIEGNVLRGTEGHMEIVAEYMDRLLHDNKWFMSDFRDITLHSVKEENAAQPTGVPHVHFVLHALYDKNKRIETIPVLRQEQIDQHNQQLEDLLNGKDGK